MAGCLAVADFCSWTLARSPPLKSADFASSDPHQWANEKRILGRWEGDHGMLEGTGNWAVGYRCPASAVSFYQRRG